MSREEQSLRASTIVSEGMSGARSMSLPGADQVTIAPNADGDYAAIGVPLTSRR